MERLELWDEMEGIAGTNRDSWIVGGDFNVILNAEEKLGGPPLSNTEASDFVHCINNCALIELATAGSKYTWWNGRIDEDCNFKRLDRVIVNKEFLDLLPSSNVQHMLRQGSYHAPLLVQCSTKEVNIITFKFLNFWTKHPQYHNIVREAWKIDFVGDPFSEFQAKMKKVKKALVEWSIHTFGNIFEKIANLEDMIRVKEIQMDIIPT